MSTEISNLAFIVDDKFSVCYHIFTENPSGFGHGRFVLCNVPVEHEERNVMGQQMTLLLNHSIRAIKKQKEREAVH